MGITNSVLDQPQPCNVNELLSHINNNDMKSFKQGVAFIDPKDLSRLIIETIIKERKEFFDMLLDKLEVTINSDPSSCFKTISYEQCFTAIVNCSKTYYAIRLIELYKHITPAEKSSLLHLAIHFENELISHRLILSGADVSGFDLTGRTPLEEAIRCNNLELVCMLLYYGADMNGLRHKLTAFTYSILCHCSEEIQRVLLEYESDYNIVCNGMSTLFFAMKYNSAVTFDLIKRGADVNFHYGIHNAISLAMFCERDPKIFRLLWNKFDYEIWKASYSKSVLLKFLQEPMTASLWVEYLKILMENETKLQLDIDHHNNSYFFKSDLIISSLYLQCLKNGVDRDTAESFVFHLLSHGAYVFTMDIDIIYEKLKVFTPFLEKLLYMDVYNNDEHFTSFTYFKYTPVPDFNGYMSNIAIFPEILLNSIKKLRKFYAFDTALQMKILDILGIEEYNYDECKEAFEASATFPSLLQLARDAARETICLRYNIKSSCRLQTIIRNLVLPKIISDILLFNRCIYILY